MSTPDDDRQTERVTIHLTPAQKRRLEACGGEAYIRRILNGPAFLYSKEREREGQNKQR